MVKGLGGLQGSGGRCAEHVGIRDSTECWWESCLALVGAGQGWGKRVDVKSSPWNVRGASPKKCLPSLARLWIFLPSLLSPAVKHNGQWLGTHFPPGRKGWVQLTPHPGDLQACNHSISPILEPLIPGPAAPAASCLPTLFVQPQGQS